MGNTHNNMMNSNRWQKKLIAFVFRHAEMAFLTCIILCLRLLSVSSLTSCASSLGLSLYLLLLAFIVPSGKHENN